MVVTHLLGSQEYMEREKREGTEAEGTDGNARMGMLGRDC